MRVLVTGGAGFIGGHLVDRLVRSGTEVIVLDNFARGGPNISQTSPRITVIPGDIRDYKSVRALSRDCTVVFHLAAESRVMTAEADPTACFSSNVNGTYNVLQAAKEAGVGRVVFTSSREVYGDPLMTPVPETAAIRPKNNYGISKSAGEMLCDAFGRSVEVTVLRLTNVYGPRDHDRVIPRFMSSALRGEPLILYGGRQILDFIHVDHVVDILMRAGFGSYVPDPVNVGSGVGTSLEDLARRVIRCTGSTSALNVAPGRDKEVTTFIADVRKAKAVFACPAIADPLAELRELYSQTTAAEQNRFCSVGTAQPDGAF